MISFLNIGTVTKKEKNSFWLSQQRTEKENYIIIIYLGSSIGIQEIGLKF